jgi:hypothetical protein
MFPDGTARYNYPTTGATNSTLLRVPSPAPSIMITPVQDADGKHRGKIAISQRPVSNNLVFLYKQ